MTRKELANKAFEIISSDMQYIELSDNEIWKAIAETDDKSLLTFLEEHM